MISVGLVVTCDALGGCGTYLDTGLRGDLADTELAERRARALGWAVQLGRHLCPRHAPAPLAVVLTVDA